MITLSAALALALLQASAAAPARASGAADWPLRATPHFRAHYESSWHSAASVAELESVYSRLKMNITLFAPALLKKKIDVYVYKDRDSYLRGEFKPPKDTAGMAYAEDLAIVTSDSGGVNSFRDVFAHELTHLYFENFFGGPGSALPGWLNEGLAVQAGDQAHGGKPWTRSLECFPPEEVIPPSRFFASALADMANDDKRYYWYLESFGITAWLFRPDTRLEFKTFCSLLKQGMPVEQALRKAYRIKDLPAFDRAWQTWLKTMVRPGPNSSKTTRIPACEFKPASFVPFSTKDN